MSNFYKLHADKFKFGWEVEIMVADENYNPLFGQSMPFNELRDTLNAITNTSVDYLVEKYVGSGQNPYYLEGYDAEYKNMFTSKVDVKGIEIRTPIDFTIEDSVKSFETLYNQLQHKFNIMNLHLCCHGNHPFQPAYHGDKGVRDIIGWSSAEVAMTTQGLVINISLPDTLENILDREKLNLRFSYAAPVMVLLAASTPFRLGTLWKPNGVQGYSERSYRRTFTRNTVYYRDDQHHRKEITLFDMTNNLSMYEAYAALSLGIILSDKIVPVLPDRFSKENIRRVALYGYEASLIDRNFTAFKPEEAVQIVLDFASEALHKYGFNPELLNPLWKYFARRETQSHEIIRDFTDKGSIQEVLRSKNSLYREK